MGAPNPVGEDGSGIADVVPPIPDDEPVRRSEIERRFLANSKLRLRASTQTQYLLWFRHFFEAAGLGRKTIGELKRDNGKALKQLLIDHLSTIPEVSRTTKLMGLKRIVEDGFDIPWPLKKRDTGKSPPMKRGNTPPEAHLKAWYEAVRKETDPYERLVLIALTDYGWRPSHLARMKREDVRFGDDGKVSHIFADGTVRKFKTPTPVLSDLIPSFREAVEDLFRRYPGPVNWPLFPLRDGMMIVPSRSIREWGVRTVTEKFRVKHNLPKLPGKEPFRHGLVSLMRKNWDHREPAALAWRGHAPDGDISSWYDNPIQMELLEDQRRHMPEGPSAWLVAPKVETISNGEAEVLAAYRDYAEGRIPWGVYQDRILALTRQTPLARLDLSR